jgi:antitoxin (DNA-binding transcriptional repressor) of toxin-antitoxin stability system
MIRRYWQVLYRLYKVFMKTLTITDAKKNLGRWLAAAARGEDIGIVCGSDIVALRKVEVESTVCAAAIRRSPRAGGRLGKSHRPALSAVETGQKAHVDNRWRA